MLDDDDCNSPVILSDPGGACECECKRERKRQCLRGCEAGGGGGWCLTLSGAEILSMTYELASFPSFFGFGFAQASSNIGFVIIIIGIKHTEAKCRCSKSFNLHFWRQFWLISGLLKNHFILPFGTLKVVQTWKRTGDSGQLVQQSSGLALQ